MKKVMTLLQLTGLLLILTLILPINSFANQTTRIISIGPSASSILLALGESNSIIGVDQESLNFPQLHDKANIGYLRTLTTEGILSLKPTIIFAVTDAQPKSTIEQLKSFHIKTISLKPTDTINHILENIHIMGDALKLKDRANQLITHIQKQIDIAKINIKQPKPKILVLMQYGPNSLYILGKNTNAQTWLNFVDANNAVTFSGIHPASNEGLLNTNATIILLATNQVHLPNQYKDTLTYLLKNNTIRLIKININLLEQFGADFGKNYVQLTKLIYQPS
ncbi:ABC transporter substrate-binding protein [Thiotrichales bacterium 19S3-7]|nr:ABC transporter substrate-binding protein [Thiotrichales bacterium 19S3-7]MCF6802838.1 ABC transporter substrate-binding protein [Thiotrichales bacterium 19S3-11]